MTPRKIDKCISDYPHVCGDVGGTDSLKSVITRFHHPHPHQDDDDNNNIDGDDNNNNN